MVLNPNEDAPEGERRPAAELTLAGGTTTAALPTAAPPAPAGVNENGGAAEERGPLPVRPAGWGMSAPADPPAPLARVEPAARPWAADLPAAPADAPAPHPVPEGRATPLMPIPPAAPPVVAAPPGVVSPWAAPVVAPGAPAPPAVIPLPVVSAPIPPPSAAPVVSAPAANVVTPGTTPPPGALVLLSDEEVIMQLGALYLTNKRAILYAPTILRAAFLPDIDAVGTVTERSGGWMLILGLLLLVLAAAAAYVGVTQPGGDLQLGDLYRASPLLVAVPLALLGLLTLASYFFWVKRSLFLSVGGRPLIVVSVSGWSPKKLEPVDSFVNAFSQAKDRARG
ncbi:MAG TPA: hypothetical protein VKY74_11010 [Chloroflexia bacterium]|nr:hypothetical protein [Chloroflexia bacterium]